MNRYLYAVLFGAAVFALQLTAAVRLRLQSLATGSTESITKGLVENISLTVAVAIAGGYLLVGLIAHILPLLLTTKVHHDYAEHGPPWSGRLLGRRGGHTATLVMTVMLMVIANNHLLPTSRGIPNSDLLLIQPASPLLIYGLWICSAALVAYWLIQIATNTARITMIGVATSVIFLWPRVPSSHTPLKHPREQPDIILIGVDSLRPDHLQSFGYLGSPLTPTIDHFINSSISFERSYTPMARTFVAYMSLLSGRYPTRHGARENLYPADKIDKESSVAHRLKASGYTTIFAMDESRFANFDHGYGFDKSLTPSPGVFDFLIGDFLDTIGTNLAQLLPYADVWMPHVAGNRAAATIYRPAIHDNRIARVIAKSDAHKPLFLISHFCIAHVPYVQATGDGPDAATPYESALKIADNQVARILAELKVAGRLNNAIVILLSDHGEALGLDADQWQGNTTAGTTKTTPSFGPYFGHGLPAMDEAQVHVLLAMQRYENGLPIWNAATSKSAVSLIDIVPTLLSTTNFQFGDSDFDGQPLVDSDGRLRQIDERPMYFESGISGVSLQQKSVDNNEVAKELSQLFEISPQDHRVQLRQSDRSEQLRLKQRAVFLNDFGVSSWPSGTFNRSNDCWMKIDRRTLRAACLPLDTADPTVQNYSSLICKHFSADEDFFRSWCTNVKSSTSETEQDNE